MNASEKIFVHGIGAVSPAGWSVAALRDALGRGEPLPVKDLTRPGWTRPLRVRQVPPPNPRPPFMAHGRLRRTSPIAHYAVAAALEALGQDAAKVTSGSLRLGIVFCAMSGCVNYSRRFYDEVLKNPATASPLVFPETVFNAPASHLAALLGTPAINYTLVGDPGIFLNGIALAADWLLAGRVDGCLVIGAEEMDWIVCDAMRRFDKNTIIADGAGAVYLKAESNFSSNVELHAITNPQLFMNQSRLEAAQRARSEIFDPRESTLLCDGMSGVARADRDEALAWQDWSGPRLSPKKVLGEGLMAAAAWQCVAALDALRQNNYAATNVSIVGCNEQAIAAQFVRS